jgi:hypothetical protein
MAKSLGGSSTSEDGNYIAETGVYIARDTFLGVSSGIFEKFTKEVWVADGDMYFRKLGKVNLPGGGTTVVRGGLGRCVDVKKTVIPARGMELLSKVAGHAASIFGIGYDLSTMKSQYESGEVSYEEHKTGVFAKVIVGGGSVAVGALVGTLGLSTMPLVAATAAVGVVGSEIEKVARGGAAVTEAEQAVKAWKDNDSRLAWDKIRQAKIALADGNWKEAQRLSRDMRKFIGSRKGENPGMPTMVEITALSSEISDTIKAERIKKEQEGEKKRAAAQKYNDDLRRKVEEWKEKERAAAAKNTDTKPPVPGNKQAIEVKQQPQTQVESKPHKIDLTTPHAAIRVMCGTTPATIRVYGGRNIRIVEEEIIGYGITREKRITVDCDFGPGHAKWALDVENDTPMHVGVHTRHTLLNKRADDRSGIRVHVEGTTEKTGLVGQGAELTVPGGGFFWTKIRLGLKYVP